MAKNGVKVMDNDVAHLRGILKRALGTEEFREELLPFYAQRAHEEEERATKSAAEAVEHAVNCGAICLTVRQLLPDGRFSEWIEGADLASRQTVYRWMGLARLPDAILRLPHLTPSRGYALLSLPDSEIKELEGRLEADGEFRDKFDTMTAAELRQWARKRDEYDEHWRKRHEDAVEAGRAQLEAKEEELEALRRADFVPPGVKPTVKLMAEITAGFETVLLKFRRVPDLVPAAAKNRVMETFEWLRNRIDETVATLDDRVGIEEMQEGE